MVGLINRTQKQWLIVTACVLLAVTTCHPVPAHAAKATCTSVLKFEYDAKKRLLEKSKMSLAAQKLSKDLLDYYYEDQWYICKQTENSDEYRATEETRRLRKGTAQYP